MISAHLGFFYSIAGYMAAPKVGPNIQSTYVLKLMTCGLKALGILSRPNQPQQADIDVWIRTSDRRRVAFGAIISSFLQDQKVLESIKNRPKAKMF